MTDQQLRKMYKGYSKWNKLTREEQRASIERWNRHSFGTRNVDSPTPGRWRTFKEIAELDEEAAS